jgi:hypothetical protein
VQMGYLHSMIVAASSTLLHHGGRCRSLVVTVVVAGCPGRLVLKWGYVPTGHGGSPSSSILPIESLSSAVSLAINRDLREP